MMVIYEDTEHPVTQSDLDDVERNIGIRLPADLRNHYLAHNGGIPNPRFFPCRGDLYGIQVFLPMKSKDRQIGFEQTYRDLVSSNSYFPRGYIPFAAEEGGDYFLYDIRPDHFGEIAFIQWDYFGDDSEFVVKLADSLAEFIEGLVDE